MLATQKSAITSAINLAAGVPAIWKNDPQYAVPDCYVEISLISFVPRFSLDEEFDPSVGVTIFQQGTCTLSLLVSSVISGQALLVASQIEMLLTSRLASIVEIEEANGISFGQVFPIASLPETQTGNLIVENVGITATCEIGLKYTDGGDASKYQIDSVQISGEFENSDLEINEVI